MLFALGQPVAFVGLVVSFVLALLIRAYAIRITARTMGLADRRDPITPRLREDVDPFGAVAAAVGGAGWGKMISVDEVSRFHGRGRAALVFASGPLWVLAVAQLVFLTFKLLYPGSAGLAYFQLADVLRGQFEGDFLAVFLISLACGLVGFGLLALIPMPPLDGFGLLWSAQRRPGAGMQGYRLWFEEKNIGVVVLLVSCFFPLSSPLLLLPLNLIGTVLLRLWA